MANSTAKDELVKSMTQSKEYAEERDRVITLVREDKERRDQVQPFFRNTNLATYAEVGRMQFIGWREKPEWKRDYQYNAFDNVTRDKVMAIVSKSSGLYEAQFFNRNKRHSKVAETIATTLQAFYVEAASRLNDKDRNRLLMISALTTPKAVWYEGWRKQMRTVRDIEERDEYRRIKKTKARQIVHYNGPWGEHIPVEDVVPGSMRIRDLQEQPRMSIICKMSMEQFRRDYPTSKYPEAAKVQAAGKLFENEMHEFLVRDDLKDTEVEVVKCWEKWDDRQTYIANGILITPPNMPMPFAHKDYPLVWGGYEELDPHFIYDMPLTIKLLDMQDVNNEVLNLTLDLVWRALNEVILVKNGDGINDDVIYGGGMIPVDDPKNFQKLEFGSSFGFTAASSVLNRVRQSIEGASVDAPSSGQSGLRKITAREALIAREAALEIASLFLTNMEAMERDKARLRVKNQLSRYKDPVDWKRRIGDSETEEFEAVYREVVAKDVRLDDGRRGKAYINITDKPRTPDVLNKINNENNKELSQTIDVSPDFIREIEFDVEIVANSSIKRSKRAEIEESRLFLQDAAAMPQVFNVQHAATDYVKKSGKNPDEALVQEKQPMPGQPVAGEAPKLDGIDQVEQTNADLLNLSL